MYARILYNSQAKLEKSAADKAALDEDRKELEKDIDVWQQEFKKNNGREPAEEDE